MAQLLNTTITGDLSVSNNSNLYSAYIESNLDVIGEATANIAYVINDASIGGTLDVSGATILHNTLDVSNNANIYGTLDVSGNTTLYTVSTTSDVTIGGVLDVSGNTILSNDLSVSGNLSIGGTIENNGSITVNNTTGNTDGYITLGTSGTIDNQATNKRAVTGEAVYSALTDGSLSWKTNSTIKCASGTVDNTASTNKSVVTGVVVYSALTNGTTNLSVGNITSRGPVTVNNTSNNSGDGYITLGTSGSISFGNTKAVTGGEVYTKLTDSSIDFKVKSLKVVDNSTNKIILNSNGNITATSLTTNGSITVNNTTTNNTSNNDGYIKLGTSGTIDNGNNTTKLNAVTGQAVYNYITNSTDNWKTTGTFNSGNIVSSGTIKPTTSGTISNSDANKDKAVTGETIHSYMTSGSTGDVWWTTGSIKASQYFASSDKRLKENIVKFEKPEKSILDLPIYKYNFITDPNKMEQIGIMAQDLQEICPELVTENEDGNLSIMESKLIYLLMQEVKDLKERIAILENK